jgi:hypothetical protein
MNTEHFDIAGALANSDFELALNRVDALIASIKAKKQQAESDITAIKNSNAPVDLDDYTLFIKSACEAIKKAEFTARQSATKKAFKKYWQKACKADANLNPSLDFSAYLDRALYPSLDLNIALSNLCSAHLAPRPRPAAV